MWPLLRCEPPGCRDPPAGACGRWRRNAGGSWNVYTRGGRDAEGEGATELSFSDGSGSSTFAWRTDTVFAIPLNTSFVLANTGPSRALLLAANTASTQLWMGIGRHNRQRRLVQLPDLHLLSKTSNARPQAIHRQLTTNYTC